MQRFFIQDENFLILSDLSRFKCTKTMSNYDKNSRNDPYKT